MRPTTSSKKSTTFDRDELEQQVLHIVMSWTSIKPVSTMESKWSHDSMLELGKEDGLMLPRCTKSHP